MAVVAVAVVVTVLLQDVGPNDELVEEVATVAVAVAADDDGFATVVAAD